MTTTRLLSTIEQKQLSIANTQLLGEGAFGKVYKSRLDGKTVAVKTFMIDVNKGQSLDDCQSETDFLIQLTAINAPNIIRYMAHYHDSANHVYWLVMEYAEHPLTYYYGKSLTWPEKRSIITGVAKGLEFLHQYEIVHRDIKGANVLIHDDGRVSICDFGFAAKISSKPKPAGSPRWTAPELFNGADHTYACDIYSFAMTAWEVAALQKPHTNLPSEMVMIEVQNNQLRETIDPSWPIDISSLIRRGWHQFPHKRPSAKEIVNELEQRPVQDHATLEQLMGKLRKEINELNEYGVRLRKKGVTTKADAIEAMVFQSNQIIRKYFNKHNEPIVKLNAVMLLELKESLAEVLETSDNDKIISRYRFNILTIVLNIAIVLTGVGAIALAIRLYKTKNNPAINRHLFFFQKETTTSEQKRDAVVRAARQLRLT